MRAINLQLNWICPDLVAGNVGSGSAQRQCKSEYKRLSVSICTLWLTGHQSRICFSRHVNGEKVGTDTPVSYHSLLKLCRVGYVSFFEWWPCQMRYIDDIILYVLVIISFVANLYSTVAFLGMAVSNFASRSLPKQKKTKTISRCASRWRMSPILGAASIPEIYIKQIQAAELHNQWDHWKVKKTTFWSHFMAFLSVKKNK